MKRSLFLCVLFLMGLQLTFAQQRPQYTQYVFNSYLLNPAVSGIENYIDLKAGYRSQWTGLQGAPVTSYVSINAPLGQGFLQGDAAGMPSGSGSNPFGRSYTQDYMAADPHHGVGFMMVSDKTGPITQTNMNFSYAYHLGLTEKLNLAVGVSAGINHISLNTAEVTTQDPDPLIYNANNSQWKPDLGVGLWAYSANYYIGASVQQLLKQNLYFQAGNTTTYSQTVPHYFFTAGVKFPLNDDVALLPSVLVKVIQPVPTTFDVNLKMAFQDIFWLGASYRKDDSFGALAGINVSSSINIGYSYDFTTSALNTVSNGTHEIVIGILLNNRYKVRCPQRTF